MSNIQTIKDGVIQQVVFKFNEVNKQWLAGCKINNRWFSFGFYPKQEQFPLKDKEGSSISFEYEQGERFGEVNLQSVKIVDKNLSKSRQNQSQGSPNPNTKGKEQNGSQSVLGGDKKQTKVKPKAKLYGSIVSVVSGKTVKLNDDKLGEVSVELTEEQLEEVKKIGGGSVLDVRFTGFSELNKETNNYEVRSGWKVYKPVKEVKQSEMVEKISQVQDAPFNSKERQFKMTVGNLMNVAAIACDYNIERTVKFAEELFPEVEKLRVKLISDYKDTRSDGDISSKLGDCLKHAAQNNMSVDELLLEAEGWVKAHIELEDQLKGF